MALPSNFRWIVVGKLAIRNRANAPHYAPDFVIGDLINALSDKILALMDILVGFYIAVLATISRFSNGNLDQVMKGRVPSLQAQSMWTTYSHTWALRNVSLTRGIIVPLSLLSQLEDG